MSMIHILHTCKLCKNRLNWSSRSSLSRLVWAQGTFYWTVGVHQRCGRLPNYFGHLFILHYTKNINCKTKCKQPNVYIYVNRFIQCSVAVGLRERKGIQPQKKPVQFTPTTPKVFCRSGNDWGRHLGGKRPAEQVKGGACYTCFVDEVLEDGFVLPELGIVEFGLVFQHELLHLGPIIELQQGAVAPHQTEDEQSLEVHRRQLTNGGN